MVLICSAIFILIFSMEVLEASSSMPLAMSVLATVRDDPSSKTKCVVLAIIEQEVLVSAILQYQTPLEVGSCSILWLFLTLVSVLFKS